SLADGFRLTAAYSRSTHSSGYVARHIAAVGQLVCVREPTRQLSEAALLGSHRLLSVGEAARARRICAPAFRRVEAGDELHGFEAPARGDRDRRGAPAQAFCAEAVCMMQLDLYNSHMSSDQRVQELTSADVAALIKSHEALEGQGEQLKHQLDWFKKQLFGRKSERRLIEPSPHQLSLGENLVAGEVSVVPAQQQVKSHTRRR